MYALSTEQHAPPHPRDNPTQSWRLEIHVERCANKIRFLWLTAQRLLHLWLRIYGSCNHRLKYELFKIKTLEPSNHGKIRDNIANIAGDPMKRIQKFFGNERIEMAM